MIHHQTPFVFVHIPKTGGTSVEQTLTSHLGVSMDSVRKWLPLYKHWYQHLTIPELKKRDFDPVKDRHLEDYFKFSFVRNPWDRLVSEARWRCRFPNEPLKPNRNLIKQFLRHPVWRYSFCTSLKSRRRFHGKDSYITNMRKGRGDTLRHILPQWKFIYNKKGEPLVDFIGRFENLQADFDIICDKIGIARHQLPHRNKTQHKHYTEYYDDETREIVAEKYTKDIEYFGYEFGE